MGKDYQLRKNYYFCEGEAISYTVTCLLLLETTFNEFFIYVFLSMRNLSPTIGNHFLRNENEVKWFPRARKSVILVKICSFFYNRLPLVLVAISNSRKNF